MPYVRNKLTWGTERVYYVLKPLLPEGWEVSRGRYKLAEMKKIFSRVKATAQNVHKVGTLEVYRVYHELIRPRILELRMYKNRLITSQSVNRTEEDRFLGLRAYPAAMDPFAHTALLFDKILIGLNSISDDWQSQFTEDPKKYYEHEVYHPVGPFFFPFKFRKNNGEIEMVHAFEETVHKTNEIMESKGSATRLGATRRRANSNEPQYGNYEFAEMLFSKTSAARAKIGKYPGYGFDVRFVERSLDFLPDDVRAYFEEYLKNYEFKDNRINVLPKEQEKKFAQQYDAILEKSTYLNRQMIWAAIKYSLFRQLEIECCDLISMESSYTRQIIPSERARTWKLMENADFPMRKEAEDSSINRILGGLWNGWLEKRMRP